MRNGRGIFFFNTIGRFSGLAVLLVVLLCGKGWGACLAVQYSSTGIGCSELNSIRQVIVWTSTCGSEYNPGDACQSMINDFQKANCSNGYTYLRTGLSTQFCQGNNAYCRYNSLRCDSECDADSVYCINKGGDWEWQGCEIGCVENTIDSTVCDTYREQCATLGGVFEGTALQDGCSAVCNTCGNEANKKILEVKSRSCCSQGLAPSIEQMCTTPLQSGIGMTVSSNANLECSDPNLSDEALQSYVENCANPNPESSASNPGSSGDGGSSGGDDTTGVGYDYYPILDTIRDSLVDIRKNVETITTCLVSPGTCAGLMNEGDTVIVNASDSTYIKQLGTKLDGLNSTLDTSVQNSSSRLQSSINVSIANANDTLIDSIRKYTSALNVSGEIQSMDSANREHLSDIERILRSIKDSNGVLYIDGIDSAINSGGGADTAGTSFGWLDGADALADSILQGSGFAGLDFEDDSLLRDSLENIGYFCNNDSCCIGSRCIYFDSDSLIEDSLSRYVSRMGDSIDAKNTAYLQDTTSELFQEVMDSVHAFNPLGVFDSTLLNTLGSRLANTNTCPEHCSKFDVNIPFFFGTQSITIDYGLCLGRTAFASGNVLSFLRFIIRLIVAITCITAVMWNASRIKR